LIAGFEQPDRGEVFLGSRLVASAHTSTPPEVRGVGMVFQDYALFPHLSIYENVAFGINGRNAKARKGRVHSMLKLVGLEGFEERYPHELSGGERQRVALARALAPQPVLILLDEPFSNLDADRRAQMREEVRTILKGVGATAIFVTHDQEEALFIGDRLAVFHQGRLEQVGAPEQVYHQPATRTVANFIGQTDFLPGTVVDGGIQTEIGLLLQATEAPIGTQVEVAFRPDDLTIRPDPEGKTLVVARHFKGALNMYRLRLPSGRLIHALQPHNRMMKPGTRVTVQADPGHPLACFEGGIAVPPLD
jgi:iron(III) transport system ATP-binding protein